MDAISEDKVSVAGYFVWSLLDNFEWADGFQRRFGIYYVDYDNNLTRTEKLSAQWFRSLVQFNVGVVPVEENPDGPVWTKWNIYIVSGLAGGLLIAVIVIIVLAATRKGKDTYEYTPLMRDDAAYKY